MGHGPHDEASGLGFLICRRPGAHSGADGGADVPGAGRGSPARPVSGLRLLCPLEPALLRHV